MSACANHTAPTRPKPTLQAPTLSTTPRRSVILIAVRASFPPMAYSLRRCLSQVRTTTEMKTYQIVIAVTGVASIAVLGFALFLQAMATTLPFEYAVRAEFGQLPETDEPLRLWFLTQPGVTNCVVGRNGDEVRVYFVMVQIVGNTSPQCPDVKLAFKKFGYLGKQKLEQSRTLYCGT